MKASLMNKVGDPDTLQLGEVKTPEPRPGNVLIKVLAAGINRLDHYIREGSYETDLAFPHILGSDAAGEIAALGDGVTGFEIGERVIPTPGYPTNPADFDVYPSSAAASFVVPGLQVPGVYAQFTEVPARSVLKDDTELSPELVATLPMLLATGVRAVKVVGEIKAGQRVLVTAGASGVGGIQIQIAKALGAEVAATVRNDAKGETLRALGADLVVNSRNEDVVERILEWTGGRGVDATIDNVGGDMLAAAISATRPLGIIVSIGFVAGADVTFNIRDFFFAQKQLRGSLLGDPEDLKWGLEQVRAGTIQPVLERTFPLSEANKAHELIANNQTAGTVVLLPWAA